MALAGCVTAPENAPVIPPTGFLFTHYKAALQTNYQGSGFGTRKGSASTHYLLMPLPLIPFPGLDFAWGDAAIRKAAADGGITTVKGADYEFMSILGLYAELTVHAYGD